MVRKRAAAPTLPVCELPCTQKQDVICSVGMSKQARLSDLGCRHTCHKVTADRDLRPTVCLSYVQAWRDLSAAVLAVLVF